MSSSPPPAEGPQPKKRKANPNATPKATSKATPKTTPKATPKKKAPKANNGKTIPIATSLEHAHEAELEMIEMRKKGIKWAEVAVMWEEKTGMKSTTKVLSGRFCRMMDNLQVWPAEHVEAFIAAKKEVEANAERLKWTTIKEMLQKKVGKDYGIEALKTKFKQIEKDGIPKATARAPASTNPASPEPENGEDGDDDDEDANGVKEEAKGEIKEEDDDEEMKEDDGEEVKEEDADESEGGDVEDFLEPVAAGDEGI